MGEKTVALNLRVVYTGGSVKCIDLINLSKIYNLHKINGDMAENVHLGQKTPLGGKFGHSKLLKI